MRGRLIVLGLGVLLLDGCLSTPTPVMPAPLQETPAPPATKTSAPYPTLVTATAQPRAAPAVAASNCRLNSAGGKIQHVIFLQFDNLHWTRDNPNVPSDVEQMPQLLSFITGSGTLLTNHHTALIAHTGTDILTALTGVYPDRHGMPIANSFRYFKPDGTTNTAVSFAYWTAFLTDPNTGQTLRSSYNMLDATGKNAPAPWVPFTRAGCNFGAIGMANIVLENTLADVPSVFGQDSPEAQQATAHPGLASSDLVGIAIHCAAGDPLCSSENGGRPDLLPDEPGGYSGFNVLFGSKYIAPQISPNGPLSDLNGSVIQTNTGHVGFPGFDALSPAVSLAYVAEMQEHGIPITFAYVASAHYARPGGESYAPGEPGYVKQLADFDDGFGKFFKRLAQDGIDNTNTLFVISSDEGDHLVSGTPDPAGCDGVKVPCSYSRFGAIDVNLSSLLSTQGVTTPFKLRADSAPTLYLTGNPARTAGAVRAMERDLFSLTVSNPYTDRPDKLVQFMADPVEMKLLHMITADSARTPTLTLFGNPDYYFTTNMPKACGSESVCIYRPSAWNHGNVTPDINLTWLGLVGPGIRSLGKYDRVWSDHTDIRPTMLALLGLKDDYASDGRVLTAILDDSAVPGPLRLDGETVFELGQTYKRITAPVGELALSTLNLSTTGLASDTAGDTAYSRTEDQLAALATERDALALQISRLLQGAEFEGQPFDAPQAKQLVTEGQALIDRVDRLAPTH